MARVHERRRATSVGAGAARHKQAQQVAPKKPSYKVVLEEVSEQKKLKTFLSFNAEAPPGFTFIPAGDPQLTNRCKQLARDDGSTVYIVTMSDPKNPELSHEVHRVGYHFSSRVVENACLSLGVTLTESGRVLQSSFATLNEDLPTRRGKKVKSKGKGKGRASPPKFDLSQSQATIDTQAREAIRDLFPKIPEADLHETVARSFQKGRDLVGTSSDLSLARRAHLAVLAHIRHTHTNYDNLLKLVPWAEARKRVEGSTLDMLISWRDDVDDDTNAMRDVLREVIIISDNEDDEDDLTNVQTSPEANRRLREDSVEVISASDNVHTRQLDLAMEPSELESEQRNKFISKSFLPNSQRPHDRLREERQGAHRRRRWEEAVDRQRKNNFPSNSHSGPVQHISEPTYQPSLKSDPVHHSRMLQTPIAASSVYTEESAPKSNNELQYFPQRRVEHAPHYVIEPNRHEPANFARLRHQIVYPSDQNPSVLISNPEYYQKGYRPAESTLGHSYTQSQEPRYTSRAPLVLSADSNRFLEVQQPIEKREAQYVTTEGERRNRRHQSEIVLPSVEMDDLNVREQTLPVHDDPLYADNSIREVRVLERPHNVPSSGMEPRNRNEFSNLVRAPDNDQVYAVGERLRKPPVYDDHDRIVLISVDGQPPEKLLHHRAPEQKYDKPPFTLQQDPRIIQLSPRAPQGFSNFDGQVQPVFRSRQAQEGRSLDLSHQRENIIPLNSRRASYTQPTHHMLSSEPSRALGAVSVYPNNPKSIDAFQSSVPRIVSMDGARDDRSAVPAKESHKDFHVYHEFDRPVRDDAIDRRPKALYMSSER